MLRVPWLVASELKERVSCCHSAVLLIILPTRVGIARLSRPRATVCKFSAPRNSQWLESLQQDSNPGPVWLRVHHTTTCLFLYCLENTDRFNNYYLAFISVPLGQIRVKFIAEVFTKTKFFYIKRYCPFFPVHLTVSFISTRSLAFCTTSPWWQLMDFLCSSLLKRVEIKLLVVRSHCILLPNLAHSCIITCFLQWHSEEKFAKDLKISLVLSQFYNDLF